MADLRAKRIRAGAIIILVSVVVVLVVAAFARIHPEGYRPETFVERISHMGIRYVPKSYTRERENVERQIREELVGLIRDWPDSGYWADSCSAWKFRDWPDSEARKEATKETKLRVFREMKNLLETGAYEELARDHVYLLYEYFPFSYVFIPGMAAIGVGAILLIVGLTTKAGNP